MARTPAVDAAREIIALREKGRLVVSGRLAVQVAEAYLAGATGGCVDGNACSLPNTQCQWSDCRKPISANAETTQPMKESGPQLLQRLGMDATKWCAEMHERGVVTADPAPGEMFHAWMCNAIMNAYDIGRATGVHAAGAPAETKPEPQGLSAAMVARAFEVMLPKRIGGLVLEHNPQHRTSMGTYMEMFGGLLQFTNPLEQQKIEATDELWLLKYEPANGDLVVRVAAATLPALAQWLEDNGLAFGS